MQVSIPHQSDIQNYIERHQQLKNKSNPTKEERKSISSFEITLDFLQSEFMDWNITQSLFDELAFLAFNQAIKLLNIGYSNGYGDLVSTFHSVYELCQHQIHCFNHLIELGIDVYGEYPQYENYHNRSKEDLFNALPNDIQAELLKQGLQI